MNIYNLRIHNICPYVYYILLIVIYMIYVKVYKTGTNNEEHMWGANDYNISGE